MLKASLVNPFLESAYSFLTQELGAEVSRGQLRLEESRATSGAVSYTHLDVYKRQERARFEMT